jgi:uncharacterized protein YceK
MKKILIALSFTLLSGCALVDSYLMAKYDTNEYAAITTIRSQSEVAQAACGDKKKVELHIDEIYKSSVYFKNFAQLRVRNEETSTIAYNLYLITDQLKKHYEKNEAVSVPYCKLKLQQVEKGAITAQKAIGSKPR